MIKINECKLRKTEGNRVVFPVSYRYNGGTVVDGEWHEGYEVAPPSVPEGFELVGIGVGLDLNCEPPLATAVLRRKRER